MSRVLRAFALAFVALQPMVAMAVPSPSPALNGVLAAPPASDFAELPTTTAGIFEGPFDAKGFVTLDGSPDPTSDQTTMQHDGFISGFGRTWLQKRTSHVLVEAVLAFNGRAGATKWMQQSQTADKAQPQYQNAISVDGLAGYYGEHLYDSKTSVYSDAIILVKGNDAFLVILASRKNDLGTVASTQAKKQYDAAPDGTIPKSQWPETTTSSIVSGVAKTVGGVVVGILVLVAIVAAVFVLRSRRRPALQAIPVQEGPVQGGPVAGAAVPTAAAPVAPIQMSQDRRSWWDGTTWHDAEREVPPAAQRSGDGHFWWDGASWRPVAGQPPGA